MDADAKKPCYGGDRGGGRGSILDDVPIDVIHVIMDRLAVHDRLRLNLALGKGMRFTHRPAKRERDLGILVHAVRQGWMDRREPLKEPVMRFLTHAVPHDDPTLDELCDAFPGQAARIRNPKVRTVDVPLERLTPDEVRAIDDAAFKIMIRDAPPTTNTVRSMQHHGSLEASACPVRKNRVLFEMLLTNVPLFEMWAGVDPDISCIRSSFRFVATIPRCVDVVLRLFHLTAHERSDMIHSAVASMEMDCVMRLAWPAPAAQME
jgi:hypothetical protein